MHIVVRWVKDKQMKYLESFAKSHDLKYCGSMVLSVQDSGVGMSEENLKELFQEGELVGGVRLMRLFLHLS